MKKVIYIFLSILCALSCKKVQDDEPKARTYVLDELVESCASLNDDGSYLLEASLYGLGFYVSIGIHSQDLNIPEGEYEIRENITNGGCSIGLNDGRVDKEVTSGNVTISKTGDVYSIRIELMSRSIGYIFNFDGKIDFDTTIEPSENTIFITEGEATRFDMNTWQNVVISGVSKYTLTVIDPLDNTLASIEFINTPGKSVKELAGEYDIQSDQSSKGVVAGAVNWGAGSGSFFYDDYGSLLYITGGKIKLTCTMGETGLEYYSITGNNLSTVSPNGSTGSGTLHMKHMQESVFSGTVIRNIAINSLEMGRSMKYSIYLPGDYDREESFPVLYLLHGYGDDNNAWIDKGMLVKSAYSYEKDGGKQMIVVCPDGLTTFYYDSAHTRYESYFFNELIPEIESSYKVRKDRYSRAVAGLSMGGYGTLYYSLKYPELFCYSYACSAAIDMGGSIPSLYDLASEADSATLPGITLEMGTNDYTTGDGSGFHNTLETLGISHEYIARSGSHDWKFWQECLPKIFKRCGENFD